MSDEKKEAEVNSDEIHGEIEKAQETKQNPFLKGWNDFIFNITDKFNQFQESIAKQTAKNQESWEDSKVKMDSFLEESKKNWDNTVKQWNEEISSTYGENKELWEKDKEKIKDFFENTQENWEQKTQKWSEDMERRKLESKEQWEARKQKINEDIKKWQKSTEKGFKRWRKEMLKGSYLFLVFMLPILAVLFAIVFLLAWLFSLFQ